MSETILKKKKIFDYEAVVKKLRPLVRKWKDIDAEFAKELHEYYLLEDCNFLTLCEKLDVAPQTIYRLFDKHELPRKYEKMAGVVGRKSIDDELELEPAVVEDELESELEDRKFKETYAILKNAQRLSKTMFQVPEKQELIEELQATVRKLTTLLLKLESNIEE